MSRALATWLSPDAFAYKGPFAYRPTQSQHQVSHSSSFNTFAMADKEATVYIVDMGRSMGEKRYGREESDLDWAMTYVWEKITSTVSTDY